MKEYLKKLENEFGSIIRESDELKIYLTQNAYIESNGKNTWYQAVAIDKDENEYRVTWEIYDHIDINQIEDESDACNWDVYTID